MFCAIFLWFLAASSISVRTPSYAYNSCGQGGKPVFPAAGGAYFPHACSVISREAALDPVDGWSDVPESLAVRLLRFGAHPGNGQDLSVLDYALLEFAEQDPQSCAGTPSATMSAVSEVSVSVPTCGVVARPERVRETRHLGGGLQLPSAFDSS